MPTDRPPTLEHSRSSENFHASAENLSRAVNPIETSKGASQARPENLNSISRDGGLTVHFPSIYGDQQAHASQNPSDSAVQKCMPVLNNDNSDEANIARVAECEKGVDHPELVHHSDY